MPRDYSSYKYLKVEVEDGIATVTFNRPEALNAMNAAGRSEAHNIWADLGEDDDVKVVILTGAGRAFNVGADVKELDASADRGAPGPRGMGRLRPGLHGKGGGYGAEAELEFEKPIIAAVNGIATGLGGTFALASDIVIAADTAKFGDHHIKIAVPTGDGGTLLWPLLVGPHKAKEFLFTGDLMDAQEADRRGLVNKVVPLKDLMPTARALARRLADGPLLAIGLTKRSINKRILRDLNLMGEASGAAMERCFLSEDHKEAAKAFVEKRAPKFKGR